ncbi:hypothetical protein [Carboxydocella sp. ULO1]|uniref:hypothetical protein n=1 Tax=Carboxydocella sp. ULO1 TaxID=1926599 RepID=UPI0009AEED11|nr:hypothetical protein [Carboxydocella sp. ULO1]GAW27885.1 hypothetical protein ULO1_04550 [Carboxydocella sp. ULO1]
MYKQYKRWGVIGLIILLLFTGIYGFLTHPSRLLAEQTPADYGLKDDPGLAIVVELVKNGYNVLVFDFRHSGQAEGEITSVGQYEANYLLVKGWFSNGSKKNI